MPEALDHHAAWLARTFGRTDYLAMTPDDANALASVGTAIAKYEGTHLFRQGSASSRCYIIEEGLVELYRTDNSGRSIVVRLGPGDAAGDVAMFQDAPYLSSARAATSVRALEFERESLVPLLLRRPVVAMRWLVNGVTQMEAAHRRVVGLMKRTVIEQVAGMILDESDAYGDVSLSQAAMADLLGVSRQSVNEALSELRKRGGIVTGYRRVTILDRDVLSDVSST